MKVVGSFGVSVMGVRAESGIEIDGIKMDPNFIRFCRRLVRDSNFRGSDVDLVFGMWPNVSLNEQKNILPYMDKCDVCIDTTLAYEFNVLAPYIRGILTNDGGEKSKILKVIDGIEGIDSSVISANSLYKEFV
jgi:uridine kinase